MIRTEMARSQTRPDHSHAARCLESGNLDDAERICRRLLKRNRKDVDAAQVFGSVAWARGASGIAEGTLWTGYANARTVAPVNTARHGQPEKGSADNEISYVET